MSEKMSIVTEVGIFGELNMEDPTCKDIRKKSISEMSEEELDQCIENARKRNLENL